MQTFTSETVEKEDIIDFRKDAHERQCLACGGPVAGNEQVETYPKVYPAYCTRCEGWIHNTCAVKSSFWRTPTCPVCKKSVEESACLYCPSCEGVLGFTGVESRRHCPACQTRLLIVPCKSIGGKETVAIVFALLGLGVTILFAIRPFLNMPLHRYKAVNALCIVLGLFIAPPALVYSWAQIRWLVRGVLGLKIDPFDMGNEGIGLVPKTVADDFHRLPFRRRVVEWYITLVRLAGPALVGLIFALVLMAVFGWWGRKGVRTILYAYKTNG